MRLGRSRLPIRRRRRGAESDVMHLRRVFERRLTQRATAPAMLLLALAAGLAFHPLLARFAVGSPTIRSKVAA
ncbi:MAG: hypothetical protein ACJA1L_001808 [Paracoccaceae bacterium]|jgi:hypothetical protein